jgi:hypothetical protein
MTMHLDETVTLPGGRVIQFLSDGTYVAEPAFGFHTGPEHGVGVELTGGKANAIVRPDGTYELEYV